MEDKMQGLKILELLGAGGFGKVYKCTYEGKTCAVKKVPVSKGYQSFRSVMSELLVLSKVKHPRIVKFVNFYQTSKDWNFIIEYMANGSLRDLLNSRRKMKKLIGQDDVLELFMDIVIAVKYLHSKGIIHRDLKPENCLLDKNHRIKIADFGIAKLVPIDVALNHTAVGTLSYMAPEVYLHQPYDRTVDTWALGLLFYELATLNYALTTIDKTRIMNPSLSYIVPKINRSVANLPASFQDLLNLMLQRDPKKRADLSVICRLKLVENIYQDLQREEKAALFSNEIK